MKNILTDIKKQNKTTAMINMQFKLVLAFLLILGGVNSLGAQELMEVEGGIKVGNTTLMQDGTIRYNTGDFEGYVSGVWKSLTTSGETVTTLINNNDGTFSYTAEDGTTTVLDIGAWETITSLVDNNDGTATYTAEDGTITTINTAQETVTTIVDNNDGTATYTAEDGTATTINTSSETLTTMLDNGDGTFTYTSEDGTTTVLDVNAWETITSLVDNNDGTATYTAEDGTTSTINTAQETTTTLVDNNNGTATYTSEDGTATTINTSFETLTTLLDNGNGTFTYTSEDGTTTLLDINAWETLTSLVDNNDGTATYTAEDGTATTINTSQETITTLVDNNDGTSTYTSEDGTATTINTTAETLTTLINNGDGTFTYTSEDGTATVLDISVWETITSLVDNNDGTATYTAEDGATTTINTSLETVTTLVDNGDGTATYTAEDGTITNFDLGSTSFWQDTGNDIYNLNSSKVGIGTTTPLTRLHVEGIIRADRNGSSEYVEMWHGGANGFINTVGDGDLSFRHDDINLMSLTDTGKLIIGNNLATPGNYNLYVKNGIMTEKVKVAIESTSDWADDAFYRVPSIGEVEESIKTNSHLYNVPSAQTLVDKGYSVTEMDARLLEQSEWLWMHMIELKKENEELKKLVQQLLEKIE